MAYSPPIPPDALPEGLHLLPGFGPGAQVMTTYGEMPVDWMATGDRVLTRDHGAQPVLWIGHVRVPAATGPRDPGFATREIATGALGCDRPNHPTLLAPHTRVMLSGYEVDLHAGTDEALAEIADLADGQVVTQPPAPPDMLYTYLLLPMHEVVQVNGLWAETLLFDAPARAVLSGLVPASLSARADLAAGHARTARLCLATWEVRAILGATGRTGRDMIDRVA